MGDRFEWDENKARSNLAKHGVSFEAAALLFKDVFALDRFDLASDPAEARFAITGLVKETVLTVVYAERGDRIRIISARRATKYEENEYHQSQAPE